MARRAVARRAVGAGRRGDLSSGRRGRDVRPGVRDDFGGGL